MEELLKRWAELEPERCRIDRDSPNDSGPVFFISCIPPESNPDEVYASTSIQTNSDGSLFPEEQFVVQGFVQKAIEARGWSWAVGYRADGSGGMVHWARVMGLEVDGTSPAKAILSAHLEALEALNNE